MESSKIQHLIVLMMENRAFDHMLGYLEYPAGVKFEGLAGKEKSYPNSYEKGQVVYPKAEANYAIHPGPNHTHPSVMTQLLESNPREFPYKVTNCGFAADYATIAPGHPEDALKCFKPEHLPVLSTLAKNFAVCDHWFSSVPGETWPNRNYAHSANSDGEVGIVFRSYANKTIFEQLAENQRDWAIYYDGFPPQSIVFSKLWEEHDRKWVQRFKPMESLFLGIRTGHLPHYAFLEPDMLGKKSDSQHPSMGGREDFKAGERLIWSVYHALRENRQVFERTLLLLTYDEHGGFFDHVAPPEGEKYRVEPAYHNQDDGATFPFDLLGARVPAVLVSPWIPAGAVDQTAYDHSSIPATLRKIFQVSAPALSPRDAQANTFEGVVRLDAPRQDLPEIEEPQVNEEKRMRVKDVELRQSLAWIAGKMIWQHLEKEAREAPEIFDHLQRRLGLEPEGEKSAKSQGLGKLLDTISPRLSDTARRFLEKEEEELGSISTVLKTINDSFSLPVLFRVLEIKIEHMLGEEDLEDDAQALSEHVFHLFGNPIVILRQADGKALEEPGENDFRQAWKSLNEGPDNAASIWLAGADDRWLDFYTGGRAAFFDQDPEKVFKLEQVGESQAVRLFDLFKKGDHDSIRDIFQGKE